MRSRITARTATNSLSLQRQPIQHLLLVVVAIIVRVNINLIVWTPPPTTTAFVGSVLGFSSSFQLHQKSTLRLQRRLHRQQQHLQQLKILLSSTPTVSSCTPSSSTCLFSLSSNFIDPKDDSNTSEEDLSRWERMYVEGE